MCRYPASPVEFCHSPCQWTCTVGHGCEYPPDQASGTGCRSRMNWQKQWEWLNKNQTHMFMSKKHQEVYLTTTKFWRISLSFLPQNNFLTSLNVSWLNLWDLFNTKHGNTTTPPETSSLLPFERKRRAASGGIWTHAPLFSRQGLYH